MSIATLTNSWFQAINDLKALTLSDNHNFSSDLFIFLFQMRQKHVSTVSELDTVALSNWSVCQLQT